MSSSSLSAHLGHEFVGGERSADAARHVRDLGRHVALLYHLRRHLGAGYGSPAMTVSN